MKGRVGEEAPAAQLAANGERDHYMVERSPRTYCAASGLCLDRSCRRGLGNEAQWRRSQCENRYSLAGRPLTHEVCKESGHF